MSNEDKQVKVVYSFPAEEDRGGMNLHHLYLPMEALEMGITRWILDQESMSEEWTLWDVQVVPRLGGGTE